MKTWMFASDFDGTLHFWDGTGIHEEDILAVNDFQKKGNLFGICTGRSLSSILASLKEEKRLQPDFIISGTGSVISDGDGNILQAQYIPYEVLKQVADTFHGEHMFIPARGQYYPLSDFRLPFTPDSVEKKKIEDFSDIDIDTFSFEFDSLEELRCFESRLAAFDDVLSFYVNIPASIDVVAKGVSKGSGLLAAARLLHHDAAMTAGMGDSYNDGALIQSAARGFTFPSSPARLQDQADAVVNSVAEALNFLTIET